ncbi:filamentous hemagglutinin N-terminal domain-containing protein [Polaromonas sp.]|uniref:two-partner secretion domain-containing protein n=1 Tax=Polaromonas sp. TaxID=1869339 RepID=UPI0032641315
MNHIYRTIWNASSGAFVAVAESTGGQGKRKSSRAAAGRARPSFAVTLLSACLMLGFGSAALALPADGVVAAGSANISSAGSTMTINQSTTNAVINWQSFGIAAGQTVQFVQPGSTSVALNRVLGADASSILGNLSANGKVFLLNPNGVLFGSGSQVNVGGLVATTMSLSDAKFMTGDYSFSNAGNGSVVNQGTINAADSGYVALMGKTVINQGVITAHLGSVALAGGQAATLDLAGDGLLHVSVTQGAVNALVDNGGMIRADGGKVLMTTQAAGSLLHTAVNNSGVIQAQTIGSRNGTILLLGDMDSGTMNVGGTLDASAPAGGNGGFIETSAAKVSIQNGVRTTAAPFGQTGQWRIDPQNFIIGPGGNISSVQLGLDLGNSNVTIITAPGPGDGDIFVNDAVTWTPPVGQPNTTLTLNADRDVNINAPITATRGNLVVCCGRDINVNDAITTTDGSILLSAGRDVNKNAAMTANRGNIMMCAANNLNLSAALTLTDGNLDPTRSLGLPRGLTLSADTDGTGPGVAGGTVIFAALTPPWAITNAPVTVTYNPAAYTTPTDYSSRFTLTAGAALTQRMLVFPEVTKTFDGTTSAVLASLKGNPAGVSLVANPGSTAVFSSADPGTGKTVTFTGYTLAGPNAGRYALATSCCGPIVSKTTGTVTAALPYSALPYSSLAFSGATVLAMAGFTQFPSDLMPAPYAGNEDVFLALAEEEKVAAPTAIPSIPPKPYVARRYAPKPERN